MTDRKRILVVEDEAIVRSDLKQTLKRLGYEVAAACSSGEEAVERCRELAPDLVLMDIGLGGTMDGVEAASVIIEKYRAPVVYMSAFSDSETLQRTRRTNPYGYIVKPFNDQEMKLVIEVALTKAAADRELKASEAKFRELFDSINHGVAVYEAVDNGRNMVFKSVNPAGERIGNVTEADIAGKDIMEVFPGANRHGLVDNLREVWRTGEPCSMDPLMYENPRLGRLWVGNYLFKLSSGEVVAVYVDVTATMESKEQLRKQSEKNDILLDKLPCIAMILEKGTRTIVASNKAAREIGAVPGAKCYEICARRADRCPFCLAPELWATGEPQQLEVEYRDAWYECRWLTLSDDLYVHYIFDITERKKTESYLKTREAEYQGFFNQQLFGVAIHEIIYDESGNAVDYRFLEANQAFGEQTGLNVEDVAGKTVTEVIPGIRETPFIDIYGRVVRTGKAVSFEQFTAPLNKHYSVYAFRLLPNQFATIFLDITGRKQADQALIESEAKFKTITEGSPDAIFITDTQGNYTYVNRAAEDLLGYSFDKLTSMNITDISHPEDREKSLDNFRSLLDSGSLYDEIRMIRNDGSVVSTDLNAMLLPNGLVYGSCLDITDRKRAEERLTKSLAEKEILLREVHHRVKNNLQTVASLIRLQAGSGAGNAPEDILADCQRRIRAIAFIHEKLYQSSDLSRVDLGAYLKELAKHVLKSSEDARGTVTLATDIAGVQADIDLAIPCGLMVNELVSNAVRHAFPGNEDRAGVIRLTVSQNRDGGAPAGAAARSAPAGKDPSGKAAKPEAPATITITVADDGAGLPAGFDIAQTGSLGLQLVKDLAEDQLGGTLELRAERGTTVTITIPASNTGKELSHG